MGNEEGISKSDMLLLLPAFHEVNKEQIAETTACTLSDSKKNFR